jgi:hypothetical protein
MLHVQLQKMFKPREDGYKANLTQAEIEQYFKDACHAIDNRQTAEVDGFDLVNLCELAERAMTLEVVIAAISKELSQEDLLHRADYKSKAYDNIRRIMNSF